MIDFTGEPVEFNPKAIPASKLFKILLDLGDLEGVIVEPRSITGNLLVFRRIDETTMRLLGMIDVAEEYFEPETEISDFEIPNRWQKPWP